MLDFDHIITVLIKDWQTIPAGTFLSGGFYAWMAHKVTSIGKSEVSKIIWIGFSIFLLRDILKANTILFDSMTYVAVAILFTHIDIFTNPIKKFFEKMKERSYNKYKKCTARNEFIKNHEAQERRDEQKARDDSNKQKQQEKFLNNLSKKLDSF